MHHFRLLTFTILLLLLLQSFSSPGSAESLAWEAVYFNDVVPRGRPVLERHEPKLANYWGLGSPLPGAVPADYFSAIYRRVIYVQSGTYRFSVTADDGVRLFIDGQMMINQWREQDAATYLTDMELTEGPHTLEVHYFEVTGEAQIALRYWQLGGLPVPKPITDTEVATVDDVDPGFVRDGHPPDWWLFNDGFRGRMYWSYSNRAVVNSRNTAIWFPSLPYAGVFRVEAYIPKENATTRNAIYQIHHTGGVATRRVDQAANPDRWVSLGVYFFADTVFDRVELSDVTYEGRISKVAFDAVRFVPIPVGDQTGPQVVVPLGLSLTPQAAVAGTPIIARVTNLAPGERVRLFLGPVGVAPYGMYGSAIAAADGVALVGFNVPLAWPSGEVLSPGELTVTVESDTGRKGILPFYFQP